MKPFSSFIATFVLTAFTMTPLSTLASGGGSASIEDTDPVYADGKAIYSGRKKGVSKAKYCVNVDGELKKLKGRTIKTYKGAPKTNLAANLYNCNQPDQLISSQLKPNELDAVLYYLNQRYKLALN